MFAYVWSNTSGRKEKKKKKERKKQSPVAVSRPRDQTDVEGFFLSSHAERSHHPQSGLSASLHPNETQCLMCRLPFSPCGRRKLKFVPLVNRGPCSQDPTGSPLLPSTSEKRYLPTSNERWRGGSFVGSTLLFRIVLIPPLSRAPPSLSLCFFIIKALLLFQGGGGQI